MHIEIFFVPKTHVVRGHGETLCINTLLHISITYFLLLLLQRPLELGADLVMHSCSKYLGGHADIISGVLATSQDNLFRELKTIQRYRGATPSAFDCYLLQRSLQTLEVSQ